MIAEKVRLLMCVNTAWQKANLCGCAGLSFGSLDFLYKHTHNLIYKKNTQPYGLCEMRQASVALVATDACLVFACADGRLIINSK